MAGLTTYAAKKVADLLFGNTAYSVPATYYLALSTTTPNDDNSNWTEPSGNNYARVSITNNTTNFPNATVPGVAAGTMLATKPTGGPFTFPTASGSWGTVTWWGLFDAITTGNCIIQGALTSATAVGTNNTPTFASGALSITVD